jgi:hypothetical protein
MIHAQRFESFAWTLFSTGIKPKSGFQRKISVAGVRWYEFTVAGLAKQKSLPDPVNPAGVIYFIGKPHIVILLVFFFLMSTFIRPETWPASRPIACRPHTTCMFSSACSVRA